METQAKDTRRLTPTQILEVKFINEYMKNPHDYKKIIHALDGGIISPNSHSKLLRKMYDNLAEYKEYDVYYDCNNRKWRLSRGTMKSEILAGYTSSVEKELDGWQKYKKVPKNKVEATMNNSSIDGGILGQTNLLYGIEYEFVISNNIVSEQPRESVLLEMAEVIPDGFKYCKFKTDSSIDKKVYGYATAELVTIPAPIEVHRDNFAKLLKSRVMDKIETNYSCGLHVHVSIIPFTIAQIYKMFHFMYRKDNLEFLHVLSRRNHLGSVLDRFSEYYDNRVFNYSRFFYLPETLVVPTDFRNHLNTLYSISGAGNSRGALAISQRHKTIECRLFENTTSISDMLTSLEFMDAMCTWVVNSRINDSCYKEFLVWLTDPFNERYRSKDRINHTPRVHPRYPNLCKTLQDLGYVNLTTNKERDKACA